MTVTITLKSGGKIQDIADRILKTASDTQNARYVKVGITDEDVAEYAVYQEFGWVQSVTDRQSKFFFAANGVFVPPGSALVLPPRPTFRATFAAENQKWRKIVQSGLKKFGVSRIAEVLALAGMAAANDLRATITNGGTSQGKFPERSDLTMALYSNRTAGRKKSGPSNLTTRKPLIKTGRFLHSIDYQVE